VGIEVPDLSGKVTRLMEMPPAPIWEEPVRAFMSRCGARAQQRSRNMSRKKTAHLTEKLGQSDGIIRSEKRA